MEIAYKVVEKRTRHGSNFTLMKQCCTNYDQLRILRGWRNQYRKWFPTYKKNKIVRAPEGSLGIMAFRTEQYAEKFLEREFSSYRTDVKIITVEGIVRMPTPEYLIGHAGTVYVESHIGMVETEAYNFMALTARQAVQGCKRPVPSGLVCFRAVRVLE